MKIGFDAKRLFKSKSGLGAYSRSLVRQLLYDYPDLEIHLYTPRYEETEDLRFFTNHPNVKVHILPSPSWLWRSFLHRFISSRHHLDVYHGLSFELPWFRLDKSVKTVVTVHDVLFKSHPQHYSAIDRFFIDFKLRWSTTRADHCIAVSESTKKEYIKYYRPSHKVSVVHPMLDEAHNNPHLHLKESEFRSLYNLKKGYYLYVGDIKGRKDPHVVMKALSLMTEEKRKKLVIITSQNAQHLLEEAESLGVYDWVRIENGVDNRTLSHYYTYCTALIYASDAEGFGIPVLEAIKYRARVICTDHPAIKEAGGNVAHYFESGNAQQLSEILNSLLLYERKREEETLSHLNIYNPKLLCEKVMRIYTSH